MENNNRYFQLMNAIEKVIERLEEKVLRYESKLKEKDEQLREIRVAIHPLDDNIGAQKRIVDLLRGAKATKARVKKKTLSVSIVLFIINFLAAIGGVVATNNTLGAIGIMLLINGAIALVSNSYYSKKTAEVSTLENLYTLESAEQELTLLENLRNEKYKEFEDCRKEKSQIQIEYAHTKKAIEQYRVDYTSVYERMNFVNNLVNGNVDGVNIAFGRDTTSLEVVKRVRTDAKENNLM